MDGKDGPPLEDLEVEYDEFGEQDDDCDQVSNNLKEYDIKLLKGMKGFVKLLILWLINKEKTHGYELTSKLNKISPSEKRIRESPGKIYPILHNLEKEGLITGTWKAQGKRKIKYYEITEEGIETLARIKMVFKCHRTPLFGEFWRDMYSQNE